MHMKAECEYYGIKNNGIDAVQATMVQFDHSSVRILMEKAFNTLGMLGCPRHLFTTVCIL